jgi:hypothetical protein
VAFPALLAVLGAGPTIRLLAQEAAPPGAAGTGIEVETAKGVEVLSGTAIPGLELRPAEASAALVVPGGKKVPADELTFIRFPGKAPAAPGPAPADASAILFLRDSSELSGRITAGDEDVVRFRVPGLGSEPLSVPLESVRGLLVAPAEASGSSGRDRAANRGAWRIRLRGEIASRRREKDEVILLQEGRVQGILESLDAEGARFGSDTLGDLKIGYEKLRGIILAEVDLDPTKDGAKKEGGEDREKKKGGRPPRSLVRVTLQDGSSFPASLREIAGGKAALDHDVLGALSAPLEEVGEIAFLGGKTRYLSDMEPALAREHLGPAFQKKMPYRPDANVLGDPLRMGGREYRKGLGVHSYSLLQYTLGGQQSRFQATIGLDDSARPFDSQSPAADVGHVVFRVRVDQRQVLEKAMSWRDAPLPVNIPVAGARVLELEVDFGAVEGSGPGFNFARDRANWAEARIIEQ